MSPKDRIPVLTRHSDSRRYYVLKCVCFFCFLSLSLSFSLLMYVQSPKNCRRPSLLVPASSGLRVRELHISEILELIVQLGRPGNDAETSFHTSNERAHVKTCKGTHNPINERCHTVLQRFVAGVGGSVHVFSFARHVFVRPPCHVTGGGLSKYSMSSTSFTWAEPVTALLRLSVLYASIKLSVLFWKQQLE